MSRNRIAVPLTLLLYGGALTFPASAAEERILGLSDILVEPVVFQSEVGESGQFTWWLPEGADEYVLPIAAGMVVNSSQSDLMLWLRRRSPWSLTELPALGLRYDDALVVIIVPWPEYAELIIEDRMGIRYSLPKGRHRVVPVEMVAMRRGADPLNVARAFRTWRQTATNTGGIPRPRTFARKVSDLKRSGRLMGAPHFYLWGPGLFSRHDVTRRKWVPFARALRNAPDDSIGARLVQRFSPEERGALEALSQAEWPMNYLTLAVSGAIDKALTYIELLPLSQALAKAEVIQSNKQALAMAYADFLNEPATWGDGLSTSLLDGLQDAGIERALLLLSDLYGRSLNPDVARRAEALGYLIGPYDSYHSIHSPNAAPDETWETAQFDRSAFEQGRVLNADGSGHAGFRGRGYHFSPQAAWPYVQGRVGGIVKEVPYSAWFVDCDATAECFDDFHPDHPATKLEDAESRRQRLTWLETKHGMVVGSEGGSVLFADVIHFGHGVHTPYIGHLHPGFRDRQSPYFLGRHWPPDTPEQSFKPVPVPPALKTPYFDPTLRIPLYQAALGDELIVSHHWSFDSLKFSDIAQTRELLEILYRVPPMYHLNRETWPQRRAAILSHLRFWGPLHRELAMAPLIGFACLSKDRLVQRTTFKTDQGEVTITVNFGHESQAGYPAHSASVAGPSALDGEVYLAFRP